MLGGKRSECIVAILIAVTLAAPLALADELTGDRLARTDADGDGYADALEGAVGSDAHTPTATPLKTAITSLRASLAQGEAVTSGAIRDSWASGNVSQAGGAAELGGALLAGRSNAHAAFTAARSDFAAAAAQARPHLPPEEQSAFDGTVASIDTALANGAEGVRGALGVGAGLAGTSEDASRELADMAFDLALDRTVESFTFARMRATTAEVSGDAIASSTARFGYESEVASGTVGDEDASGAPVQGLYVDRDGDGARSTEGDEDATVSDRDRDGFSDKAERASGTDPMDARSNPEDVDGDRWSTSDEILASGAIEQAVLGAFDAKRTPTDADGDGFVNSEEDRDLDGLVDAPHETDPDDAASHPRPLAGFSHTPSAPTTLDSVDFVDASVYAEPLAPPGSRIVAWFWDFGDGASSTARDPMHRFAGDGLFLVRLTVREDHGATSTHEAPIEVANVVPAPAFAVVSLPSLHDPVLRLNASASSDADGRIATYAWSFGDGNSTLPVSSAVASHRYAAPGAYRVTLTVADDDGAIASAALEIVIANIAPVAAFSHQDPPARAGFSTSFRDGSWDPIAPIVSWRYDFGDGASSNARNVMHTYAVAGPYDVVLTVTDSEGASAAAALTIVVHDAPVAAFGASAIRDDVTPIAFTDLSVPGGAPLSSWYWEFGDGASSALQHPTHLYRDDGVYVVTLTVTDAEGIFGGTSTSIAIANLAPLASFDAPPGELRTSQPLSFHANVSDIDGTIASMRWSFGDGATSTSIDAVHTYASYPANDSRQYAVTLVAVDDDGAQSVVFVRTITVFQDTDADGVPDVRDADADNDASSNDDEARAGSNPRDEASTPSNLDGDGIPNLADRALGNAIGRPAAERDPCAPIQCA